MARTYTRSKQLGDAYALLRHPVWAWLAVYGDDRGGWEAERPARKKGAAADTAPADAAQTEPEAPVPLSFAEIEAKAHGAFLNQGVRTRLDELHMPPPDPPGSGSLEAMLTDLETARLGALRAGDWREARAAVMDRAKLCAPTATATQQKDSPPDDRPTDVVVEEALEVLGAWVARRDAVTAAVRADRDRDRARGAGPSNLPPLQPAAPLP
jgi:hypothetical protein